MGQVLAFNNVRKARGERLSLARTTCLDIEEQCSEEIRAKLSLLVAELSAVVANLEKNLQALNADIGSLPTSQSKLDLEDLRNEIVVEIYTARRILAEV
jgi:hypothetical protein